MTGPALDGLTVGGTAEAWRTAGFTVVDGRMRLGGVTVRVTGVAAFPARSLTE